MRVGGERATAKDRERAQEWMNERERVERDGIRVKTKKMHMEKNGGGEWGEMASPSCWIKTNEQTNHLDPKVIK